MEAMKLGRLNHIGVATPSPVAVAPAQAGAHRVSRRKPTGEIGTSLRWCDGVSVFEG
jgi:hypothetical protein